MGSLTPSKKPMKGALIPISNEEIELVEKLRDRIADLDVENEYLELKNLVRFLRARRLSLNQAEAMIRNNVTWRRQEKMNTLLDWIPPVEIVKQVPYKICGIDPFGGLVVTCHVGLWDPSYLSGRKDILVKYVLQGLEKGLHYISKRQKNPHFTVIVDCQGLTWKHYLCYDAIQAVITICRWLESGYPETVRLLVAVNCSSVLSMFWKLAKPFLSSETHAKVNFLYEDDKASWGQFLSQYLEEDMFPQSYGGKVPDSYSIPLDFKDSVSVADENGND